MLPVAPVTMAVGILEVYIGTGSSKLEIGNGMASYILLQDVFIVTSYNWPDDTASVKNSRDIREMDGIYLDMYFDCVLECMLVHGLACIAPSIIHVLRYSVDSFIVLQLLLFSIYTFPPACLVIQYSCIH